MVAIVFDIICLTTSNMKHLYHAYSECIHRRRNITIRCYEAKIEESEKAGNRQESNPGHPGLSHQCCAIEPQQPDNHQPSQLSSQLYTA